jgi:hypothetical protein
MKMTACENFVRKACHSRFFFCEKEFASIEILIQIITVTPPNPSDNSISRRTFVKTSTLTVGAATLLCQGVSLGQTMSPNPCNKTVSAAPDTARTDPRTYTNPVEATRNSKTFRAQLETWTNPANSSAKSKIVTVQVSAQEVSNPQSLGPATEMDVYKLKGAIKAENCTFEGSTEPTKANKFIGDPWYEDEAAISVTASEKSYDKKRERHQVMVLAKHTEEPITNGLSMTVEICFAEMSTIEWRVQGSSNPEEWIEPKGPDNLPTSEVVWQDQDNKESKTVKVYVTGTPQP